MLENSPPREQAGRDSFSRYRAQVRSATLASLSILEGKQVDRVYCDLHDDFVVRLNVNEEFFYVFYQVKTYGKQNYNWTVNDIFGISSQIKDPNKQSTQKIANSFAGKLLLHTVAFGDNCRAVVFQTNINLHDSVESLMNDISGSSFSTDHAQLLISRFSECFSQRKLQEEEIKAHLGKLEFSTDLQHLKRENINFEPIAREEIFKYSEVDLSREEIKEILLKLVDLVEKKSSGVIRDLTYESIEEQAGISIEDLLDVLSISKEAYLNLINGGDQLAIKSASIIQRTLITGGANDDQVEYCTRCKIMWDNWLRNNRHILPEMEVLSIQSDIGDILHSTLENGTLVFTKLREPVQGFVKNLSQNGRLYDLNADTILGGIFSELVRSKS